MNGLAKMVIKSIRHLIATKINNKLLYIFIQFKTSMVKQNAKNNSFEENTIHSNFEEA